MYATELETMYFQALSRNLSVRLDLARWGTLPKEVELVLANDEAKEIRTTLANRLTKDSWYGLFDTLSQDPAPEVRIGIAVNPATPQPIRDRLRFDSDLDVYISALDYCGWVVDKGDGRTMRTGWIRSSPRALDASLEGLHSEAVMHPAFADLGIYQDARNLIERLQGKISLDQAAGIVRFRKASKVAEPVPAPGVGCFGSEEDVHCMITAVQEVVELAKQGKISMDELDGMLN
jgi:hypothetical protein